jgi:hypothetical protein
MPPLAIELCRHREQGSERRVVTNARDAPPGYMLEHVLGAARTLSFPGSAGLYVLPDEELATVPSGGDADAPADGVLLGHLDLTPLPLVNPVVLARHPETGQHVLLAGDDDPLIGAVERIAVVGYIEPVPLRPHDVRSGERTYGVLGLTRGVDRPSRRQRSGLAGVAAGAPAGALGVLLEQPQLGAEPVWLTDEGFLVTAQQHPLLVRPGVGRVTQWVRDPLHAEAWTWDARARGTARRALQAPQELARRRARTVAPPSAPPAGYLLQAAGGRRLPLYSAIHRVTRDQLLTTDLAELAPLDYGSPVLLGYLLPHAPLTGELGPRAAVAPWALRFGERDV